MNPHVVVNTPMSSLRTNLQGVYIAIQKTKLDIRNNQGNNNK